MLTLPKEKSKAAHKMAGYKWLLYGPPGIGKTTLANQFENALILDFEGGTKHIEGYVMPIGDWQQVREVYDLLKTADHIFETIIFDTSDMFCRLAIDDLCRTRKIEHPSDEKWGKGWDMVKSRILATCSAFQSLGLGLVFTSHVKEKEIATRTMVYTRTTTSLPGAMADLFLGFCDIIGYCHFDPDTQSKRLITFQGSDYVDAKARTSVEVALPAYCELDYNVISSFFAGESVIDDKKKEK